MLAIRMQRVGRKGHPEFRMVVQDARLTPTSGRIVARVGHVNPHTKAVVLDKEKVQYYLTNGAQPSPRVVRVLQDEKIKIPDWVKVNDQTKKRTIKNAEKLRRNRPAEEVKEEPAQEAPAEEPTTEETTTDVAETDESSTNEPETVETAEV